MNISTAHTVGLLRSLADALEEGKAYAFEVTDRHAGVQRRAMGGYTPEVRQIEIKAEIPVPPKEVPSSE